MLTNPTEYRDTLWAALHDGEMKGAKGEKSASKSQVDEMMAMLEQAKALREANPDLDS